MWVVAKIKSKEQNIFKKNLIDKLGNNTKFYCPKIAYYKNAKNNKRLKFEKFILENYIFCYHEKFNQSSYFNQVQFLRGLQYFLKGHFQNQTQIKSFINMCKSFEDETGNLKASFFKKLISRKAQFISGPLTNIIFEIIEKQNNKLKILVGNIITTISDKKNYLYRPIY